MLYIDFEWADNNNRKALTRLNLRAGASLSDVVALANAYEAVVSQISNAQISSAKVHLTRLVDNAGPTNPDSNVYDRAVFIYREGGIYGTVAIPSPLPTLFEVNGSYAGVRVDANVPATAAALSQLGQVLRQVAVLPYADIPFPATFLTGGMVSR